LLVKLRIPGTFSPAGAGHERKKMGEEPWQSGMVPYSWNLNFPDLTPPSLTSGGEGTLDVDGAVALFDALDLSLLVDNKRGTPGKSAVF